jgi:SAM-dependent methyltransferase
MKQPFRDVSGRAKGPLTSASWNERWLNANTPWDMGTAAPPFVRAVENELIPVGGRALVVGCGGGNDARLLASQGFEVVGIDVAEKAVERAREIAAEQGIELTFRHADLFALPEDLSGFDLVLEHTCFCAIDPARRDDYVDAVASVLNPGGRLMGLFFLIEPEGGPPFGATREEIEHRFGRRFTMDHFEMPPDSHEKRLGREALFTMTLRA